MFICLFFVVRFGVVVSFVISIRGLLDVDVRTVFVVGPVLLVVVVV